jgi:hypothetical protein
VRGQDCYLEITATRSLPDFKQAVAAHNGLSFGYVDGANGASDGSRNGRLHLHGFRDHKGLAFF